MGRKMAFSSFFDTAFPPQAENVNTTTSSMLSSFSPGTLLETFIPGYGPIQKFLLFNFGFDVTILVSLGAALWIASRLMLSIWKVVSSLISENYMAEISITSTDEIHTHLIQFLAHQYKIKSSRRLMAETPSKSAWELDSEDSEGPQTTKDANGNVKWLNFSNQEAKSQPRFTPAIGSHNFWHAGTYFQLRRKEVALFEDIGRGASAFKDKEILTLSCFGRSTEPIKRLIHYAKADYHQGHRQKTIIKRPAAKDLRRFGGRGAWIKIAERPCRPLNTVVLDEVLKLEVLADINEYLNPATARWYANRGIPYRRGYLFYGPPGTGKTSLTFALAGVFGLDIHVVSLLEPTLTEEELGMLFTNLPARCIVLLEDIDTAGLIRNDPAADSANAQTTEADNDFNVVTLTKALKKANEQSEEERKKGISLSGLLNIIDGVASHEGRVLVMTTNRPETLDSALIRPGRVDHQVAFTNASQTQIQELFERMYADDLPTSKLILTTSRGELTPPLTPLLSEHGGKATLSQDGHSSEDHMEKKVVEGLAREFSLKVPGGVFSPAEVQGFLLKRKKEPRRAVEEVAAWVEGMVSLKDRGVNVGGS